MRQGEASFGLAWVAVVAVVLMLAGLGVWAMTPNRTVEGAPAPAGATTSPIDPGRSAVR